MNSRTNDDRKGQHERWTEINSKMANGLQTMAMLPYEVDGDCGSPTKRQHRMAGSLTRLVVIGRFAAVEAGSYFLPR